jgi:hypothetical protein
MFYYLFVCPVSLESDSPFLKQVYWILWKLTLIFGRKHKFIYLFFVYIVANKNLLGNKKHMWGRAGILLVYKLYNSPLDNLVLYLYLCLIISIAVYFNLFSMEQLNYK